MASQHGLKHLSDYADRLLMDTEMVDLESLQKNLSEFPGIVGAIEQYVNQSAS